MFAVKCRLVFALYCLPNCSPPPSLPPISPHLFVGRLIHFGMMGVGEDVDLFIGNGPLNSRTISNMPTPSTFPFNVQ